MQFPLFKHGDWREHRRLAFADSWNRTGEEQWQESKRGEIQKFQKDWSDWKGPSKKTNSIQDNPKSKLMHT